MAATHDMAIDGYYMEALDEKGQARFVGYRVMAYRIAEHRDVMLPVNVCHDGNYLSFGVTRVEIPEQRDVDEFLGPPSINWHVALDPSRPMGVDPLTGGAGGAGPRNFVRYRKGQCRGMQNALRVIRETHAAWGERFGR